MGPKKATASGGHISPAAPSFDFEDFQSNLWELCSEEDNISQMKSLLSNLKNMTSEDRMCINVCSLIASFMASAKTLTESLGRVKQDIKKNQKNIRLIAYKNEKLEQYTRRDNLGILNFPNWEDGELRAKFI